MKQPLLFFGTIRNIPAILLFVCLLFISSHTVFGQTYCSPTYSPQGFSWRISEFSVPEISFDYTMFNYTPTDHTSEVLLLSTGTLYTFEITTTGFVGVGVAADFNNDGDFDDTDELLEAPDYIGASPANYTFPITIPTSVSPGNYRLRLWNALANAGDGTPVESPCGSYGYGTFADFTISIQVAGCESPGLVSLDAVDQTSATLSWGASADETNGYSWVVMASGDDPDTDTPYTSGTTATGVTNTVASGLYPGTDYDFYVRADCGSGTESIWTNLSFATEIQAFQLQVTGFNADVIANGIGAMTSSTDNDVDGVDFIFLSEDWKLNAGDSDAPVGLPEDGVVESADTDGIAYQMSPFNTPYEGDNSLRIASNGTSGDLDLSAPASYEALYFLVTSGSGVSSIDVEVHFSDATSESFNGITVPDWYQTGLPVEVSGFGRANRNNNTVETPFNNPKMFRVTADIDPSNQSKTITSVTFTKNTGGVFHVFAVTGKSGNPCLSPLGVTFDVLSDSEIDVSWDAFTLETGGYEWALMNQGEHPDTDTPVFSGTTATGVTDVSFTGLDDDTAYDFYIMTDCGPEGMSFWGGPHATQTLPSCAPPSNVEVLVLNDDTIEASWSASPHVTSGYNWAILLPGEDPDVDTPIEQGVETSTSVEVDDLDENTDLAFFIQTDCDPNGASSWVEVPFIIEGAGTSCDNPITLATLPYSHTATSGYYLNKYTGNPGSSCGTSENYLNGSDVVYQFSPAADMAVNIDMTDITGFYAAVFVYGSCADIGSNCLAGNVSGSNDTNFSIPDLEVTGGQDYFIVVSSWLTTSVDYTLTISESICPQPSNLSYSNLTGTAAAISWDASSNEQNGYEWALMAQGDYPDTDTPIDTDVTTSGTTSHTLSLSPSTAYSFYVRTDCGATDGMSGWAGPLDFQSPISTGNIPTSEGSFDSSCTGPEYTISYELPTTGGPWEVTGVDITYAMTAANGAFMSEQRSAIYCQNTGNEEAATSGSGFGGTYQYNRTNVPIANGYYTDGEEVIFEMRAWRTWSSFGQNGCTTYNNQVDDGTWEVTVYYQPAPTCPPVIDLEATELADDEMEVSWVEVGTASSWNIEYGPTGFTPGSGTVEVAGASPYSIDGLSPGTEYDVYVQADCGSGDSSDWEGPATIGVGIPEETYEDGDIPTSNQSFDPTCNGPDTTLSVFLPSTGGPWEVTGVDVEYAMTAGNGAFMSEQRSALYCQNTGNEEAAASGSGFGGTYQYDRSNVPIANGYYADGEEVTFEMRAWRTWSSFGQEGCTTYNNKVDDGTWTVTLYFTEAPSCLPVQNAFSNRIHADEMEVEWTEIGSALEWTIEYGEVGFAPGTGTLINSVTSSPYTISGLDPSLEYEVYIQSDCGGGDTSDWVGPIMDTSGEDCGNPLRIWALPYIHEGTTSDYGNDYSGSPGADCSSTNTYLNGNDVVYEWVPDEDMTINLELLNVSDNYAGMFLYEACEDIGTTCAEGVTNGFDNANLELLDIELIQGQSYYVVIATQAPPESLDYTLKITRVCTESPAAPEGSEEQGVCIGATLADLDVTGTGIVWYETEDAPLPIAIHTELEDGETYYASQVVASCESSERLAVTVTLLEQSAVPEATENQTFVEGETIEDLTVDGENLLWYADVEGTVAIPTTTLLEDQETYFVSQLLAEHCESELFGITVYEVLTAEEEFFAELYYYPNPVENQLTIVNSMPMDGLVLYNTIGQQLLSEKVMDDTAVLQLEGFPSGVYFLKISIEDSVRVYKISKK